MWLEACTEPESRDLQSCDSKQRGGQQLIDVSKETSYDELEKQVVDLYFPRGRSMAQNLELADLNFYLASFSGEPLPKFLCDGGFTVSKLFEHIKTYPVRVYLHTSKKDHDDSYLPDLDLQVCKCVSCTLIVVTEMYDLHKVWLLFRKVNDGGKLFKSMCFNHIYINCLIDKICIFSSAETPDYVT